METFPFFVTAVLVAQVSGVHNRLTHWGALAYISGLIAYTGFHVSGIPLIASLFWNIATFGILTVLAAPLLPQQAEAPAVRATISCT